MGRLTAAPSPLGTRWASTISAGAERDRLSGRAVCVLHAAPLLVESERQAGHD